MSGRIEIVAARLGVKSTIEETRTARYISIGNLTWPPWTNPQSMPIPLKYSGALTHRFAGDWSLNAQNLGRASEIRKGIKAPALVQRGENLIGGPHLHPVPRAEFRPAGRVEIGIRFPSGYRSSFR